MKDMTSLLMATVASALASGSAAALIVMSTPAFAEPSENGRTRDQTRLGAISSDEIQGASSAAAPRALPLPSVCVCTMPAPAPD